MHDTFRGLTIMNTWKPIITMNHTSFDKEICNLKKAKGTEKELDGILKGKIWM